MGLKYAEGLLPEECREVERFCRQHGMVAQTSYWAGNPPNPDPRRHLRILVPEWVAEGIRKYKQAAGHGSMSLNDFLEETQFDEHFDGLLSSEER